MAINYSCATTAVPIRPRWRLAAAICATATLDACAAGQDNAADVLDRRVAFKLHICGGLESDAPPGRT